MGCQYQQCLKKEVNKLVETVFCYLSEREAQVTNLENSETNIKSTSLKVTMSPFDEVPKIHIRTPQLDYLPSSNEKRRGNKTVTG